MEEQLIASIDQGTSSSRAIIFAASNGEVVASHQIPIKSNYPRPGWIEQHPEELYTTTLDCLNQCADQLERKGKSINNVIAVGITNQRETIVAWDRISGKSLAPAIVWSDARTAELVEEFVSKTPDKRSNYFQLKTGLPIHSYFSALKIRWLLENCSTVLEAFSEDRLLVGTVDSWIVWCLSKGRHHVTDVSNASRTLLFNLHSLTWDNELCRFFKIDPRILPRIVPSSGIICQIEDTKCKMLNVKICGILGDQQASLVAQTWVTNASDGLKSTVKVTYGTGAFMLWNVGTLPYFSDNGILTTVAYRMGENKPVHYALEGSISYAGATLNWLKTNLELFHDYEEMEHMANAAYRRQMDAKGPEPCYLVPAFSGLFCPWWHEHARAIFAGISADVRREDLVYAGIRSAVLQTHDVLKVATLSGSCKNNAATLQTPRELVVDGGMSASAVLMQSLADILNMNVRRHNHSEMMTALGAAVAAALAVGIDPSGLLNIRNYPTSEGIPSHLYEPKLEARTRQSILRGWHKAVERSLGWVDVTQEQNEKEDTLMELLKKVKRKSDSKGKCREWNSTRYTKPPRPSLKTVLLVASGLTLLFLIEEWIFNKTSPWDSISLESAFMKNRNLKVDCLFQI